MTDAQRQDGARAVDEETNGKRFASPQDIVLLDKLNAGTAKYPDDKCLHDLFWEQAKRTPSALAVVDGGKSMTYRQLDEVTDRLASILFHEYGVRPDTVVGIFMERSAEYVIAYIAILKAGGAYCPIELVYPTGLVKRVIDQTSMPVVLTKSKHAARLKSSEETGVLTLDNLAKSLPVEGVKPVPAGGFDPRPNPDNLGFVVMSSGTTGTPKGICQVHRSAVHSYWDRFTRFPYHVDPATKQISDRVGAGVFFVWECIRPLLRGATCVVIPDDVLFDPEAVTTFIRDEKVTRVLFTPSLLQLIMDTLKPEEVASRLGNLRMLWLCGEVVTVELATSFAACAKKTEILNLYSISECHDATIGNLRTELDTSQKYATCGKNIPNVVVYVVDFEDDARTIMRRVPIEQAGEVYVGGPVLARGYLKMPEKTAERFVKNPFGPGKLYRTGDMGRILRDGTLEIVGRCDFMVKVRGYSVVLGAVESALAKHPMLASAVVMAVGAEGTDKRLVAWVVPRDWNNAPSAASVRVFLKKHVPPYAIPGTFCVINALPVNQSAAGKLDRKKLPDPSTTRKLRPFDDGEEKGGSSKVERRVAPSSACERAILTIFAGVLGVEQTELSAIDDFFDVGGHSLLATRLVSKIHEAFPNAKRRGFALADVMKAPTVVGIASRLRQRLDDNGADSGIARKSSDDNVVDLFEEAKTLDPSIHSAASRRFRPPRPFLVERCLQRRPRTVLLTGATGYLGRYILHFILETSDCDVVCIARAGSDELATKRVQLALGEIERRRSKSKSDNDEDMDRVHVLAGDLSKPLLGLEPARFKELAMIDSIVHCGAEVNLIKPYAALRAANVMGTQEILRLATTSGVVMKLKPVHYISTNGIFPVDRSAYAVSDDDITSKVLCEEEDEEPNAASRSRLHRHLHEGYARTKFVAETMCKIARSERGIPCSILRPGNMSADSATGQQNSNDFVRLFLQGCVDLGLLPGANGECDDYYFDLTCVDFAAAVVAHVVCEKANIVAGRTLHLQNPNEPLSFRTVAQLLRKTHDLTMVSRDTFLQRLHERCDALRAKGVEDDGVLLRLESGFAAFEAYFRASSWMRFGTKVMRGALKGTDIRCPVIDAALMAKMFPTKKQASVKRDE